MSSPIVHLPTYHTSLIGRAAEVSDITALVRDAQQRLVTLVGASGTGKTRLALEVATSAAGQFRAGVVFVALAPVQDVRFVLSTIANEFGIQEQPYESLLQTLCRALADQDVLILLDNIEQVREVANDLGVLLRATRRLKLLVTSQVALELPEETVYAVPPLLVPPDSLPEAPEELLHFSSVALFVERLQAVQPQFALTRANSVAVVTICQLLDGYPLAIELVAAHSATLAPADLLLLLRNHLAIGKRQHGASSRLAILAPVLDWCTSRLANAVQQLFLRSGVFWGSWTLDALHAVVAPNQPRANVAEHLELLVQKHLVLIETLYGQDERYVVLDAIREYSFNRLARQKRDAALRDAHAAYYFNLAQQASVALSGAEQVRWLPLLDAELHNFRAAMQWLMELGQHDRVLRIASNLYMFWYQRSYYREGQHWLETNLAAAQELSLELQADAWRVLGFMLLKQNLFAPTQAALERSAELYRQLGDAAGQAAIYRSLGNLHGEQGRMDDAREAFVRGIEVGRQATPPADELIAIMLHNLGFVSTKLGLFDELRAYSEESLAIFRRLGYTTGVAIALSSQGALEFNHGNFEAAEAAYGESRDLYVQLGNDAFRSLPVAGLGEIALARGDLAGCRAHFEEALALSRAVSEQQGELRGLTLRAWLATLEDDLASAEADLLAGQAICDGIPDHRRDHDLELGFCRLRVAQHADRAATWAAVTALLEYARETSSLIHVVEATELAALLLAQRHTDEARTAWQAAQALRAAMPLVLLEPQRAWYERHGLPAAIVTAPVANAQPLDSVVAVLLARTPLKR